MKGKHSHEAAIFMTFLKAVVNTPDRGSWLVARCQICRQQDGLLIFPAVPQTERS